MDTQLTKDKDNTESVAIEPKDALEQFQLSLEVLQASINDSDDHRAAVTYAEYEGGMIPVVAMIGITLCPNCEGFSLGDVCLTCIITEIPENGIVAP